MNAQNQNKEAPPESQSDEGKTSAHEIHLNKDIKIFPHKPLPELDKGTVDFKALYRERDR